MIRLNRYLALCGVSSRRKAEELISQGKVMVNHKVITTQGFQIDEKKDVIFLDGKKLEFEEKVYLVVNKPKGYITTAYDPQKRPTVLDLVPQENLRIYPVGRLDYDSSGLLLLTNDGELSFRLIHPKYKVSKVYRVKVYGAFSLKKIQSLSRGVGLADGITAPCDVRLIKSKGKETILEFSIYEGKKRQIRRMCNAVGYRVVELERIQMGTIKLGSLKYGAYRYLGPNEIKKLKELVGL